MGGSVSKWTVKNVYSFRVSPLLEKDSTGSILHRPTPKVRTRGPATSGVDTRDTDLFLIWDVDDTR